MLIALVLPPRNVTGMMVTNQDRPLRLGLMVPCCLPRPTLDHLHPCLGFPKSVRARICRVREDFKSGIVDRDFPGHRRLARHSRQRWQANLLLAKP